MVPGVMEPLVGWLSGKTRGGSLLRRWAMAVTRSIPRQVVHLVDAAAPGLPEPPGQQRDPADLGEPLHRRQAGSASATAPW
jgi:hypothetical protein